MTFDGDLALQARVAGAVDLPHPAFAEQVDDFVGAETGPRCQSHGGRRLVILAD